MENEEIVNYVKDKLNCDVVCNRSVIIDNVSYDVTSRIALQSLSFEAYYAKDMTIFDSICDQIRKESPGFILYGIDKIPVSQDHLFKIVIRGIWR